MIFYFILILIIPTGVLICTENTFWSISKDDNFVKLFKKSFTLYVESGMREMVEVDITILRNEEGDFLVTKGDFKANFFRFITDHYLRKFHLFLYVLDTSNHFYT